MVSEEAGQHLNPPDPSASGTPYRAHPPTLPTQPTQPTQPLHFTLTNHWLPFSLPPSLCFYNKESTFYHCCWEENRRQIGKSDE